MTSFEQYISVQWDKDSNFFLDFSPAFVTPFLSTLLGTKAAQAAGLKGFPRAPP